MKNMRNTWFWSPAVFLLQQLLRHLVTHRSTFFHLNQLLNLLCFLDKRWRYRSISQKLPFWLDTESCTLGWGHWELSLKALVWSSKVYRHFLLLFFISVMQITTVSVNNLCEAKGPCSLTSRVGKSYLPGVGVNHDHQGGSPRARLSHCTPVGLTPAITPNVGNSDA